MNVGYARVSTHEQNLDLQQDALKQADCQRIIVDQVSGSVAERPGLTKLKEVLREGDTLVVWRLDRLGRSIKDLITLASWLEQQQIGLRSLHESIDTTTPSGRLTFHIFAALAEFERQLIQERTRAGLHAARARGRQGGRPRALQSDKRALVVQLYNEKKLTVKKICELMEISKPTLYAYVRQAQA
jgi:DNA invertase Pin-like site-specific DNA recombinase